MGAHFSTYNISITQVLSFVKSKLKLEETEGGETPPLRGYLIFGGWLSAGDGNVYGCDFGG